MNPEPIEDMTTFIAGGTTIKGEVTFQGPVRISGRVEGIIHAEDLLELTPEGVVEGDIHGTFIDIQGTVKGNISASKSCRLVASARIEGELRAANLAIAEGACFVGKVHVGCEPEEPEEPIRAAIAAAINAAPAQTIRAPEPAAQAAQVARIQQHAGHFAQPAETQTPVTVLQSRLEQMAVEAEQVAVATQMNNGAPQNEPQVRINGGAVQGTLNRQPRIIKATR